MSLINRAFRNVWRKKTRTILVIILLGISVSAIISVYTGVEASTDNTEKLIEESEKYVNESREITDLQETMIQVSALGGFKGGRMGGGMFSTSTTNITLDIIENISLVDYVEEIIPLIEYSVGFDQEAMREEMQKRRESGEFGRGTGGGPGNFEEIENLMASFYDYAIMGVPVDSSLDEKYLILPSDIIDGRKITQDDESMLMIREELTLSEGFFSGSKVGDTINIEGYNFTIAGIYSSDTGNNYVYMDINEVQKILGLEEGQAFELNVYTEDKSVVEYVVEEIKLRYEDLNVISYLDINSRFSDEQQTLEEDYIINLQNQKSEIENIGITIIAGMVVAISLIVLFLMMYTVKERTKEIGLMKAIGFKGKSVMTQFIIEGTTIGILGGIIGIIIGVIFGPVISKAILPNSEVFATSTPGLSLILFSLFLTIILGALGTIYPAWQASRKSPMEAMRNE